MKATARLPAHRARPGGGVRRAGRLVAVRPAQLHAIDKVREMRARSMRSRWRPRRRCSRPAPPPARVHAAAARHARRATARAALVAAASSRRCSPRSISRINQYAWEGAFFLLALGAVHRGDRARAARRSARARRSRTTSSRWSRISSRRRSRACSSRSRPWRCAPLSPQQARTLIDRMLADLARMELMVTQILESVRLERGRVDLRPSRSSSRGAVARVVAQLRGARRARSSVTVSRRHRARACTC